MNYGFTKVLSVSLDTAEKKVNEELKKEGFGVLTRIDIKEKFREKLGIEFMEYIILGACNPPNAKKAIEAEENIGLMLPCNIVLYNKNGKTHVSVIRPTVAMSMIDNNSLSGLAMDVEKKLKNVFDNL